MGFSFFETCMFAKGSLVAVLTSDLRTLGHTITAIYFADLCSVVIKKKDSWVKTPSLVFGMCGASGCRIHHLKMPEIFHWTSISVYIASWLSCVYLWVAFNSCPANTWNVTESKFPTTVHTASSSPCFRFGNIWVTLATPPPSWETTTGFFHQNMVIDSFEILLPKRLQHTLKHIPHVSQPQSEWCCHWLQKCFLEKNIYHKAAPAVVQGPMVGSWRDSLLAPSAYETKIWDDAPHAD